MEKVSYGLTAQAWENFTPTLLALISENSLKRVCEIGGGANPCLSSKTVADYGLDYSILDLSETELKKAPSAYKKIVADISESSVPCTGEFDLVFSKMLAEHIKNGEVLHRNVYNLLAKSGIAFHFFPTLYGLPFLVNRMVPEKGASLILDLVAKRDRFQHEKFPAYYSWCRGPTNKQISKFENLGYRILDYRGFFGHEEYYRKIPLLQRTSQRLSKLFLKHPIPQLTSYAYVILRK